MLLSNKDTTDCFGYDDLYENKLRDVRRRLDGILHYLISTYIRFDYQFDLVILDDTHKDLDC